MKSTLLLLFLITVKLSYSQNYLNLNKGDIIALKGNDYTTTKDGYSIVYIENVPDKNGYPMMPNVENFSFDKNNVVNGYSRIVNEVQESYALKIITENNNKYEKISPKEHILLKWVDRKNLIIFRIGWIIKGRNNLYSVHYEVDKVDRIE